MLWYSSRFPTLRESRSCNAACFGLRSWAPRRIHHDYRRLRVGLEDIEALHSSAEIEISDPQTGAILSVPKLIRCCHSHHDNAPNTTSLPSQMLIANVSPPT